MYQLTKDMKFGNHVKINTHKLIDDNQYTPGGMVYFQQWGTARHAANSAFLALQAYASGLDVNDKYLNFAKSQANYIMGDNPLGQNYIVGFTDSSPKRPHHAASSCPLSGQCNWDDFSQPVRKNIET